MAKAGPEGSARLGDAYALTVDGNTNRTKSLPKIGWLDRFELQLIR